MRRMARTIWLAAALALAGPLVGNSSAAAQSSLSSVAGSVASAWAQGDADAVARLISPGGVALHLLDQSQPAAGVRQARAALAELMGRRGSARLMKVEELGGAPARGFAELQWEVTEPGSPEGLRYVVFLGFVAEGDGWRIAEIRVLR
jgi:ketosteroid isomerase-like protein